MFPTFISGFSNWGFFFFVVVVVVILAKGSSRLFTSSENQLLVSLIFKKIVFLFSILSVYALILIFFLQLTLSLVFS